MNQTLAQRQASNTHQFLEKHLFHLHFLVLARQQHQQINPYYYDIDPQLIHNCYPEISVPQGPPHNLIIEEPPFITITPWQSSTSFTQTLIIKAPSHVYQLDFIRALFPNARLRLIHLCLYL